MANSSRFALLRQLFDQVCDLEPEQRQPAGGSVLELAHRGSHRVAQAGVAGRLQVQLELGDARPHAVLD